MMMILQAILLVVVNASHACQNGHNGYNDHNGNAHNDLNDLSSPKSVQRHDKLVQHYKDGRGVVLISIDGFRFDYIYRGETPFLASIAEMGEMGRLRPQYPSSTFPNHFSMATGLRPESHGIVNNVFYDKKLDAFFRVGDSSKLNPCFWNAKPIWNLAEEHGLRSAAVYYPGTDVAIGNKYPFMWRKYKQDDPETIASLTLTSIEKAMSDLTMVYFESADSVGHRFGPFSPEVNTALDRLDNSIKLLFGGLKSLGILNSLNIVIVSDHGFGHVPERNIINLSHFVENYADKVIRSTDGPVMMIEPKDVDSFYAELGAAVEKNRLPLKIFRKEQMPPKYHFSKNPRIMPIIVEADIGWNVCDKDSNKRNYLGHHGYDPAYSEMDGIFIAYGPQFQPANSFTNPSNLKGPFENLDVYNFLASLLKIPPDSNEGSMEMANSLIRNNKFNY